MKRYVQVIYGTFTLLCIGIIYAWSILVAPIAEEFSQWNSATLSMTFTICMFSFCLGGFVRGITTDKMSTRSALFLSAILYSGGLFIATTLHNFIAVLYVGFGVMGGFATGITYNAIMTAVTSWFQKEKSTVSGILLMGFGFGGFCTGKVFQSMISCMNLDWRFCFHGFGVVIFLVLMIAALLITSSGDSEKHDNTLNNADIDAKEMICTPSFRAYFLWLIFVVTSGYMIMGHGKNILAEVSPMLDAGSAATIVGLISIFNGAGRAAYGILYNQIGYRKTLQLINGIFALAIVSFLVGLNHANQLAIVIGFICTGLFFAGAASMNSTFVNDFYGSTYYSTNFAIVNLNVLISSFGGALAGIIYDAKGSYLSVIIVMIVFFLLATGISMCIKRPNKTQLS